MDKNNEFLEIGYAGEEFQRISLIRKEKTRKIRAGYYDDFNRFSGLSDDEKIKVHTNFALDLERLLSKYSDYLTSSFLVVDLFGNYMKADSGFPETILAMTSYCQGLYVLETISKTTHIKNGAINPDDDISIKAKLNKNGI